MADKQSIVRGCLLGMAVGDAMGYTVDGSSWPQIQMDYGPNGLLGYDLVNGYADVTSYTQLAAFACNGLLLGMTRGQMQGKMAPLVRYVALAEREWAQSQRYRGDPGKTFCWVTRTPELTGRRCMDTMMLDTLSRERLGTPEEPTNRFNSPSGLTSAVAVGLFSDPGRLGREESDRLGAEVVALTHGNPATFLSGAVLSHLVGSLCRSPETDLSILLQLAVDAVQIQFGRQYPQLDDVLELLRMAKILANSDSVGQVDAMEQLHCKTAPEVLAGALYACMVCGDDFDSAMITAVNHSGRSAAVGAVTGALLGAKLGEEALPDFYLECLEPAGILRELADDMAQGCPMDWGSCMFDDDWDRKYVHGGK